MADAAAILALLEPLVAFRTDLEGHERPLADHLAALLAASSPDAIDVVDVPRKEGKDASYVYARFGTPRVLVNAHIDTVPPNADWSSDPFTLRDEGERVYALGAADTKGAIAAILDALRDGRPNDCGILFSGDEEWSGVAVRAFLASPHAAGIERAIVCEPTSVRAGVRHRGIGSFEVTASSPGGHSSRADDLPSPIATLSKVGVALDGWGRSKRNDGPPGYLGMCMNLAKLEGGVAFNVIPAEARLLVSLRPPPGADTKAIAAELAALVKATAPETSLSFSRDNAPFATRDLSAFEALLGEPARAPLDLGFWTEAAVLAAAGIDAVVVGPGDIAQAHAPNEWVTKSDLVKARAMFAQVFGQLRGGAASS